MRTAPNEAQARYLHQYFERRLSERKDIGLTDAQRQSARDALSRISPFSTGLCRQLTEWSTTHIPSALYSAGIRAANKKLKRYKHLSLDKVATTVSVSKETAYALESVDQRVDGDLRSKDAVISFLTQLYDELNCAHLMSDSTAETKKFEAIIERALKKS